MPLLSRTPARLLAAALALAAAAPDAGAQTTFFGTGADLATARAGFLAALVADGTSALDVNGTTIDFGPGIGAATLTGGTVTAGNIDETGAGATAALTFSFNRLLTGFGGEYDDLGTCCSNLPFPEGTLQYTFRRNGVVVGTTSRVFTSALSFYGVVTPFQFDRVELRANSGDAFDVESLAVGANPVVATPEPGTWALLATGLAGVAGAARRRARA